MTIEEALAQLGIFDPELELLPDEEIKWRLRTTSMASWTHREAA